MVFCKAPAPTDDSGRPQKTKKNSHHSKTRKLGGPASFPTWEKLIREKTWKRNADDLFSSWPNISQRLTNQTLDIVMQPRSKKRNLFKHFWGNSQVQHAAMRAPAPDLWCPPKKHPSSTRCSWLPQTVGHGSAQPPPTSAQFSHHGVLSSELWVYIVYMFHLVAPKTNKYTKYTKGRSLASGSDLSWFWTLLSFNKS